MLYVHWASLVAQRGKRQPAKQVMTGDLLYDSGNTNLSCVTKWRSGMGWETGGKLKREGTHVYL